MDDYSEDEVREALRPIASLTSKSEKARQKLRPGTWQHTMLGDNVRALGIAAALMDDGIDDARDWTPDDLREALTALASMIGKTENALGKFPEGTPQRTLQRNRLKALRIAETFVKAESARR